MTSFELETIPFKAVGVRNWAKEDSKHRNWPVVYVLDQAAKHPTTSKTFDVYVGETVNAESRLLQHLSNPDRQHLVKAHVIVGSTFNKSACLDLESQLVRLLSGDGTYKVLNRNDGVTDADYYDREMYRESFQDIFERLRVEGIFTKSITEIENSDLFKLSPFKSLTDDQNIAVMEILKALFDDLKHPTKNPEPIVVEGGPGTGKTIVASFMLKLIADIKSTQTDDSFDRDTIFSEFFTSDYRNLLGDFKFGIVIPQQSLRSSISRVFARTPGLSKQQVLNPFQLGESDEKWDLLIVDETHRLSLRANQPSAAQNKKFKQINEKLFEADSSEITQLDWIKKKSTLQILLLDKRQTVRPADLAESDVKRLVEESKQNHRHFELTTQMRVQAGDDYIGYIRSILDPTPAEDRFEPPTPRRFDGYDLRFFDNLREMHEAIRERDREKGLARLVAGYAWEWKSKKNKKVADIEIDGCDLQWNQTDKDWINSKGAVDQVGSIHTVQGYDLNYAGVIIGPDLRYDKKRGELVLSAADYFDKKGKENNRVLGKKYTDEDILRYVSNIYAVLLTRGILGTYVYVCDPELREYLRPFFTA
ncbi:MAG: DUF2075 domain-containing protein [Cryobacterium sp.]|nr:DUF2075 domain-containing protein [Cryobacterium sp.]MBX3104950.1 DUF2075 domain-containing protein [Cryobacterium sp.]